MNNVIFRKGNEKIKSNDRNTDIVIIIFNSINRIIYKVKEYRIYNIDK